MRKTKFFIIIAALVLALTLFAACGGGNDEPEDDGPAPEIVTPGEPDPAPTPEPQDDPEDDPEDEPEEVALGPIARPAGVVYSFDTDAQFLAAPDGARGGFDDTIGPDAIYLQQAGGPTWNIFEGPDERNAIRLTDRENTWDSMDIQTPNFDWNLSANSYLLTVRGYIIGGGTAQLNGADSPHANFAQVETDGPFVITLILDAETVEGLGERQWVRVQTGGLESFEIHDVTVTLYIPRAENVVYSLSTDPLVQLLDVGTRGADTVLATSALVAAGDDPRREIVEGPYGNAILQVGRNYDWNAIDLALPNLNLDLANNTYRLTVIGHIAGGGQGRIGGADSPWSQFEAADTDGDGNFTVSVIIDAALAESAGERNWLRLQTNCVSDYTLFDIIVERQ